MPVADKITAHAVSVFQSNFLTYFRQIRLKLESGGTASILFPKVRPADWLQFNGSATILYMTEDQFADVYHVLQSENPVYFSALNLFGFEVGAVYTDFDTGVSGTPPEESGNTPTLETLIRMAQLQKAAG